MKKLKPFDYVIIAVVVVVLAIGALILAHKNKFSKSPVEATKTIQFQVMLRGVSMTDDKVPFISGEKSFITIRNVPYTELEITDVKFAPKKYILETKNPKTPFMLVDDPTQPFMYDFIITLKDEAKITDDGAVVGGNKIKIGIPIVLEGYNYRLGGTVSNVIIPGKTDITQAEAVVPKVQPQSEQTQQVKENEAVK